MNRLIAAGCSFTNFYWPSWADYLGATLFDNYVNLGAGGAGNRYIFTSLCWMLEHGELTKDDTVIIAWSGIPREDRILPGNHHWEHTGNIHYQDTYPEEGVKKYFSVLSTSTELLSYITSLNLAFKKIGCQVIMTCMFPWHIEKFLGEPAVPLIALDDFKLWKKYGYDQMLKKYYDKYFIKPSIEEYKWKIDSKPNWVMFHTDTGAQEDDHPSSWVHFKYASDILAPSIKRTAKPLKELFNESIEGNAKEWSKFYRSKEKVSNLGMINEFTMERPNILWVNKKDIPPKPDMHNFKHIEPWL